MRLGIVELYCGTSGKKGYYNSQEIGLAKAMKKLGHDITIFYPRLDLKKIVEETIDENIRVVYVPAKAIGVHSRYDWNVLKIYQIEVVQLGSDNQLFAPDVITYCDKNKILLYSFIGTTGSDSENALKKFVLRCLYKRNINAYKTHMCFAKTPAVKQQLEMSGIKGTSLAPVGLDMDNIPQTSENKMQLRQKLGIPLDKQIILFVGRLDTYKRPLEAIKLLDSMNDTTYLIMIGTGGLNDEITDEIEKRGLKNLVLRMETILNKEIHKYYQICDYYLNFNTNEIFGMSILEAMYHGCTVLACHAPGPDFIIQDKISGYLVDTVTEMQNIIKHNEKLNPEKIRSRVYEEFVWDRTAQIFDNWIRYKIKAK